MKRILLTFIAFSLALAACVGVHEDDPEPDPVPVIDPEDGSADMGTRFFRRSLVLEYTATWCQYCPNMADAVESAQKARPGRLVEVAVHYADALAAPESDILVNLFKVTSYPTVVLDYDPATLQQRHDPQPMIDHVDSVLPQAVGGVAIDATVENLALVRIKVVRDGIYRVALPVVVDGAVTEQAGYGPGYVNRAVLWTYNGNKDGYKVGALKAGEERTLDIHVPGAAPGVRAVAVLLCETDDGLRVENVAQCEMGKKIDYRYEVD